MTKSPVELFYSPMMILKGSADESLFWRNRCDEETDAKDALYCTTPFFPPSEMLLSATSPPTSPPTWYEFFPLLNKVTC